MIPILPRPLRWRARLGAAARFLSCDDHGAQLVEFAVALPLLVVFVVGIFDFSNAFNYTQPPLKPLTMITRPLPASAKRIHLTPALLNDPS